VRVHHNTDDLFRGMRRVVRHYPEHVQEISQAFLPGTAFFPGGAGTWRDLPNAPRANLPTDGILFVGHNFDGTESKANAKDDYDRIDELNSSTWLGMAALLGNLLLRLDSSDCFFTNALMGMRKGAAAGPVRGDRCYYLQCQAFLRLQIRWTKPRILVVLGPKTLTQFRAISPELRAAWGSLHTLKAIDRADAAVVDATFDGHRCVVTIIPHPSAWPGRKDYDIFRDRAEKIGRALEMRRLIDASA
jgi:hypothetical protein